MPRAEAGSTKAIANNMKSKGLQRLRWYCQPCEKQCRDENGFKCHTQSESHVRTLMTIGSNPNKVISEYSNDFLRDFIRQLRTSHNTKPVHINHFYQEYISNKEHVHMNSTKWKSLTEFAKHLGREGICRVEETEKGLHIAWIDNSPEALKRQEAVRRRERMEKGDEEIELKLLNEQVKRAHAKARAKEEASAKAEAEAQQKNASSDPVVPSAAGKPLTPPNSADDTSETEVSTKRKADEALTPPQDDANYAANATEQQQDKPVMSLSLANAAKPKNVFAEAKHTNIFKQHKAKTKAKEQQSQQQQLPKKMSETERIMREEMEEKKRRAERGPKRMRVG